jgi:hypothetical protein
MYRRLTTLAIPLALLIGACGDDDVSELANRITSSRDATAEECPNGGTVISVGQDDDGDGALSEEEIDETETVCDPAPGDPGDPGDPGRDALIRVTAEPPGENCEFGGQRFDSGLDDDANGQLDDGEIDNTTYVCDAAPGEDGADYLVRTATGTPAECEGVGGVFVESGYDDDRNGELDDTEVDTTEIICFADDGFNYLIDVDPEPPGANCPSGGQRIRRGFDRNRSSTLEATEVEDVQFLCNPVATLVETSSVSPGAECPAGGLRIDSGLDINANGALESTEINATRFVCDGEEGLTSLVETSTIGAGANCANGGLRIDTGLDDDRDGVLDDAEIDSTSFACDGDPGEDGRGNSAVRLTDEPAGANCANGGTRVETGPDTDGDGVLDDTEVTETRYVCDGSATTTLVDIEVIEPGSTCLNGGQRILEGVDTDGDGILSSSEVDSTTVVCSAVNTLPISITTTSLPDGFSTGLYGESVEAVGGLGSSYSWQVVSGALPPGLSLDSSGNPADLSGTATATGTFSFTVEVTDFIGSRATAAYSITMNTPPCEAGVGGLLGVDVTTVTATGANIDTLARTIMADDDANGWLYLMDEQDYLDRIRKDGSAIEDLLSASGPAGGVIVDSDLGFAMKADGNDLYIVSEDTSTTDRVTRISTDGGSTFSAQKMMQFAAAPDDIRGLEVDGTTMYVITHGSSATEVWSADISGTLPASATLQTSFTDFTNCHGLAYDDDYFYSACATGASSSDDVIRIDRTTFAVESIFSSSTILNFNTSASAHLVTQDADSDGLADIVFVNGDGGDKAYICDPSGTLPLFGTSFGAAADNDEGLAFDPALNALWAHDEDETLYRID